MKKTIFNKPYSLKAKKTFKALIILLLYLLFSFRIDQYLYQLGNYFFNNDYTTQYSLICVFLGLIYILWAFYRLVNREFFNGYIYWIISPVAAWYLFQLLFKNIVHYPTYQNFEILKFFGEFDLFRLLLLVYIVEATINITELVQNKKAKNKKETKETKMRFAIEGPIENLSDDKLNFEEFGRSIIKILHERTPNSNASFTIGITSEWGYGKTSFINIFTKILEKEYPRKYTIINFNPWKSLTPKQITSDFFLTLSNHLPYVDWANDLKRYGKQLANLDKSGFTSAISNFIIPESSINEKYNTLKKVFEKLKKPVVIILDDLDRMEKEEILATLRLIRNTANFPNTIFIIAYDEAYINNQLEKFKTEQDNFIDKFISLPVSLPEPPKPDFFFSWVYREVLSEESQKVLLEKITNQNLTYYSNIVRNFRRAKKIFNSFTINYSYLKNSVNAEQLMLTEIFKIYDETGINFITDTIDSLDWSINGQALNNILYRDPQDAIINAAEKLITNHQVLSDDFISSFKLLVNLISTKKSNTCFAAIPARYLKRDLSGYSELDQIEDFFSTPKETIDEKLEQIKTNQPKIYNNKLEFIYNHLMDYLAEENNHSTKVDTPDLLKHTLDKLFDYGPKIKHAYPRTLANNLVEFYLRNVEIFNPDTTKYIQHLLRDEFNKYVFFKGGVIQQLLTNYAIQTKDGGEEAENTLVLPKKDFETIALNNLETILNSESKIEEKLFSLHMCIDSIDGNNKIILNDKALGKFRRYIVKSPNEFIKIIVRPTIYPPYQNEYTFYPYCLQIFANDKLQFKDFILSENNNITLPDTNEEFKIVKRYIFKYLSKQAQSNEIKRFKVTEKEHQFLLEKFSSNE